MISPLTHTGLTILPPTISASRLSRCHFSASASAPSLSHFRPSLVITLSLAHTAALNHPISHRHRSQTVNLSFTKSILASKSHIQAPQPVSFLFIACFLIDFDLGICGFDLVNIWNCFLLFGNLSSLVNYIFLRFGFWVDFFLPFRFGNTQSLTVTNPFNPIPNPPDLTIGVDGQRISSLQTRLNWVGWKIAPKPEPPNLCSPLLIPFAIFYSNNYYNHILKWQFSDWHVELIT